MVVSETRIDGYNHTPSHYGKEDVNKDTNDSSSRTQRSERRQIKLEARKEENEVLGNLWKAHESGLAVSFNSSRRELTSRIRDSFSSRDPSWSSDQFMAFMQERSSFDLDIVSCLGDDHVLAPSSTLDISVGKKGSGKRQTEMCRQKSVPFGKKLELFRNTMRSSATSVTMDTSDADSVDDYRDPRSVDDCRDPNDSLEGHLAGELRTFQKSTFSPPVLMRYASRQLMDEEGIEVADWKNETDHLAGELPTFHKSNFSPPVLMRRASRQRMDEEGIEVADWKNETDHLVEKISSPKVADRMASLLARDEAPFESNIRRSNSFDETMSFDRTNTSFMKNTHRNSRCSFTDDDMIRVYQGESRLKALQASGFYKYNHNENDDVDDLQEYDTWVITSPLIILGTSANDVDSNPHVLSPPVMESLQRFFPFSKRGESFWMKYSMVRDGASMHTFLQRAKDAKYGVLAIETLDGEVFGAFTDAPWRKNWNFFGSSESFLWRMRHTRKEKFRSIIDQAEKESEIDVYQFSGNNKNIQLCTHERIVVGGGAGDVKETDGLKSQWGFGLTIEDDMLMGTSSPCLTFGSPSLSNLHKDGSAFEIMNLELWTLTPCIQLEEAEKLEVRTSLRAQHSNKCGKRSFT